MFIFMIWGTMSIFIILGKELVKKIQPFMLWESNSSHCLAAYFYPTYRGVLTVRTKCLKCLKWNGHGE